MKPVRLTKREIEVIRAAMTEVGPDLKPIAARIITKLDRTEVASHSVQVGLIEDALIRHSRGKVVPLTSGASGYARATRAAGQVGANLEDAQLVGAWLSRQGWFQGTCTMLTVLGKWPDWLARAIADRAQLDKRSKGEGFEQADSPPGASGPGGGDPGRGPEGFGG